ncbi:YolD-like family protein [Mesorhizobium sp. M00.F.Ca.ET.186.01.1.1]|nr:YolD-like family protein [Mesorhizobium sp. M00.F.Ca.ET.186.01.1.1]
MGSKKNDIFGSMRFLLPEQRTSYLDHLQDLKLTPQPILEEDEIQELNQNILESIHFDYAIRVRWWKETKGALGVVEEAWGWVKKIDTINQRIKLVNEEELHWISMNKLLSVRSI